MNVYEQKEKHFPLHSASVATRGGAIVTVAIKYPRDGAGRLYLYLHVHGYEMARGLAGGYGYDKASAAFEDAASKLGPLALAVIREGAVNIGDRNWQTYLMEQGFTVISAC